MIPWDNQQASSSPGGSGQELIAGNLCLQTHTHQCSTVLLTPHAIWRTAATEETLITIKNRQPAEERKGHVELHKLMKLDLLQFSALHTNWETSRHQGIYKVSGSPSHIFSMSNSGHSSFFKQRHWIATISSTLGWLLPWRSWELNCPWDLCLSVKFEWN